jgi:hypothetical protein
LAVTGSVGDPHVLCPPGSGSIIQRYGSGSGSFPKILAKIKFLILKIMCMWVSYKKKFKKKIIFLHLRQRSRL